MAAPTRTRRLAIVVAAAALALSTGCTSGPAEPTRRAANPNYPSIAMGRGRAAVSRAQIEDPAFAARLGKAVGDYYIAVYDSHQARDAGIEAIAVRSGDDVRRDAEIEAIRAASDADVVRARDRLTATLEAEGATAEQIAHIKDGMTHNGYNKVYQQYDGYLPPLTESQKLEVRRLLSEARDKSMTVGTAPEKIDVFNIEYRARIDAYLMAQGYDVATAKQAYDEKLAAERAAKAATHSATQPATLPAK